MKTLKKDNVFLRESDESKIKELLIQGFKLVDADGKVIEDVKEKTVPIAEFNKVKKEVEKLKKENDALTKQLEELQKPPENGKK